MNHKEMHDLSAELSTKTEYGIAAQSLSQDKNTNRRGGKACLNRNDVKLSPGKPLVSVVTVVFNAETCLEKTIRSVIDQSYNNVEYIIIDGGSTDRTVEIINKYEKYIDYWVSEKDSGIYDAMNKGVKVATGEWVIFINAGDLIFEREVLSNVSSKLTGDLMYGDHAIYYNDDVRSYKIVHTMNNGDKRNIPCCHQSLFYRKIWLTTFPFNTNYTIAADYDQYLRCKHAKAVINYIPVTISLFQDGGISSISRRCLIREYYLVTKQYDRFYAFCIYLIRLCKYILWNK